MTLLSTASRISHVCACVGVVCTVTAAAGGIRGIASESMPRGIYLSQPVRAPLQPGDTVEVCLPRAVAKFARDRGYLARGIFCDDSVQRIVKAVLAVPGDTVVVTPRGFVVNGRVIPNTAPLGYDSRGRHLSAVAPGTYVVLPSTIWLFSKEIPTSYDSRYFGPIPSSSVRRRFRPLWTERHRVPFGGLSRP